MKRILALLLAAAGAAAFIWGAKTLLIRKDYSYIRDAVYIEDGRLDAANDGKFVMAVGPIRPQGAAKDPDFGVSAVSPFLARRVAMFQQFKPVSSSNSSGSTINIRHGWSESREESFKIGGYWYENPQFPAEPAEKTFYAPTSIGGGRLRVGESFLQKLSVSYYNFKDYSPRQIKELPPAGGNRFGLTLSDGAYLTRKGEPKVGDLSVTFYGASAESTGSFTILGEQKNGALELPDGDLGQIWDSVLTKDEAVKSMRKNSAAGAAAALAAGAVLAFAGYGLLRSAKSKKR